MIVMIGSWYGMQATHELGNVIGAVVTGGVVQRVEFPIVGFSRTVVEPNPSPMIETWAGPIVGVAAPALIALVLSRSRRSLRLIAVFFAGFCMIANGAYLGGGAFTGAGDAGDLIVMGTARWVLVAFGVVTTAAGLTLWHVATMRGDEAARAARVK